MSLKRKYKIRANKRSKLKKMIEIYIKYMKNEIKFEDLDNEKLLKKINMYGEYPRIEEDISYGQRYNSIQINYNNKNSGGFKTIEYGWDNKGNGDNYMLMDDFMNNNDNIAQTGYQKPYIKRSYYNGENAIVLNKISFGQILMKKIFNKNPFNIRGLRYKYFEDLYTYHEYEFNICLQTKKVLLDKEMEEYLLQQCFTKSDLQMLKHLIQQDIKLNINLSPEDITLWLISTKNKNIISSFNNMENRNIHMIKLLRYHNFDFTYILNHLDQETCNKRVYKLIKEYAQEPSLLCLCISHVYNSNHDTYSLNRDIQKEIKKYKMLLKKYTEIEIQSKYANVMTPIRTRDINY